MNYGIKSKSLRKKAARCLGEGNMARLIYADNAATTKLDVDAFEAMTPFLLEEYGNPSQPYSFSRMPKKAIKEAREIIAKCIHAEPDEIYFTSGGTESNNWVLNGTTYLNYSHGAIVTDNIEHHAILRTCESIESRGYPVAYMFADNNGIVQREALEDFLTNKANLVSVMTANNEVGTIQPIKELCDFAHSKGVMFHTDAVQAVGHIPIDVKDLGIDFLSASAHKFNGPKGVGFLYIKRGMKILPFLCGGSQEKGLRAGTENVASIVGMATALQKNVNDLSANIEYVRNLETELLNLLSQTGIDFKRNGAGKQVPGNISLSFRDKDGEMILHRLDLMGVIVSTGAACDSKDIKASHVLEAMKVPKEYALGTIRISLSKNNTFKEIEQIVNALRQILIA